MGVGGSWGSIDSDGGILSKNSWRRPQLQITPSYSCLEHQREEGGGEEQAALIFDPRILEFWVEFKFLDDIGIHHHVIHKGTSSMKIHRGEKPN